MFYNPNPGTDLRFGDVIKNVFDVAPLIANLNFRRPLNRHSAESNDYYHVLLTPCCRMLHDSGPALLLTELEPISQYIFYYPDLKSDPLIINYRNRPEYFLHPHKWAEKSKEDQEKTLQKPIEYGFVDYFIFDGHDFLPEVSYDLSADAITTRLCQINFRKAFSINRGDLKDNHVDISSLKILELDFNIRKALREKMAFYFGHPAKEDAILLGDSV